MKGISKDKIHNKPNYYGFFWNPEQSSIDENCLMGVDAIIHLAGAGVGDKRWNKKYKSEILNSRLLGTTAIANTVNTV